MCEKRACNGRCSPPRPPRRRPGAAERLCWTLLGSLWHALSFAPTDAAAVAMRLRRARLSFPKWVATALEKESGLNDPMSVLLTVLIQQSWPHGGLMVAHAAILFYEESGGVASLLRWLPSAAHNDFAALWLALLLCRRFAYQGYRQFPAWNLPPLVMQALGAHGLL
jgi:hypothetical protein